MANNYLNFGPPIVGYECLICTFETEDEELINEHMRSDHGSRYGEEWEHSRAVYNE